MPRPASKLSKRTAHAGGDLRALPLALAHRQDRLPASCGTIISVINGSPFSCKRPEAMQKITPHLWFDKQAREAAEFYVSLFSGSKITNVTTLSDTPSGDCDVMSFELAGQPFMAISAGPLFH